jgi:hypothetical protein
MGVIWTMVQNTMDIAREENLSIDDIVDGGFEIDENSAPTGIRGLS